MPDTTQPTPGELATRLQVFSVLQIDEEIKRLEVELAEAPGRIKEQIDLLTIIRDRKLSARRKGNIEAFTPDARKPDSPDPVGGKLGSNVEKIVKYLRSAGPATVGVIIKDTGLSSTTVSNVLNTNKQVFERTDHSKGIKSPWRIRDNRRTKDILDNPFDGD